MTKVFIARPADTPAPTVTPPQSYALTPDAKARILKGDGIVEGLQYPIRGVGSYKTTAGSSFDFELNILDTASKLPIRAMKVESGLVKGFTDRLGRIIMHLPAGFNKVVISGHGYLEKGTNFAPAATRFEPIVLEVDLDSDAIYTVYSTGEVIPGERKVLDNPGHHSGEFQEWLGRYWWVIGLAGASGLVFHYLGKTKTPST